MNQVKKYAEMFNINPRALKLRVKEAGFKPSTVSAQDVLDVIVIYAPDLMYCRETEEGLVEYLDPKVTRKLIQAQHLDEVK